MSDLLIDLLEHLHQREQAMGAGPDDYGTVWSRLSNAAYELSDEDRTQLVEGLWTYMDDWSTVSPVPVHSSLVVAMTMGIELGRELERRVYG